MIMEEPSQAKIIAQQEIIEQLQAKNKRLLSLVGKAHHFVNITPDDSNFIEKLGEALKGN